LSGILTGKYRWWECQQKRVLVADIVGVVAIFNFQVIELVTFAESFGPTTYMY
jgi:hypothetical protein